MPDSGFGSLDSLLEQIDPLAKKIGAQTAPQEAEMSRLAKRQQQIGEDIYREASSLPDVPKPQSLPQAPRIKPEDNLQSFNNPLVVLAIFSALGTRSPATAALNAAASAMQGYHQGHLEAAKQAEQQYRDGLDQVVKQNDEMMQAYRAQLEKHGTSIRDKSAALEAVSSAFQDQHVLSLVKAGNYDAAIRIIETREQMLDRLKEQDILNEFRKQSLEIQRERMENERRKLEEGTTPQAQALAQYKREHPDATAEDVAGFLQKLRQPRSAQALAMQRYIDEHPDATAEDITNFAADYRARGAAVTAFATGKQGQIINSFNVATNHLKTLEKLADALENNDVKAFNRVANAWAEQFGGTAPNNFNSAKQIVGSEIVKAIVGSGGGVTDRQEAQSVLDAAKTPEQVKGAIQTIRELMAGQLRGLKKQYEDTTGRHDFDSRLTGAAAETLGVN